MSKPIIEIKGISKKYALSHQNGRQYVALRDKLSPEYLLKKLKGKLPEQANSKEEFWALKDVSFDVQEGEAVGIIGRNGAGKSTLLKVLSKIVSPTEGEIILRGRVASLLEVGTGFHPELTGRENIYLNGAILGMRRKEIDRKFDEIVDFSGVEKFLDTPVKRYSSGMYVRLAFAVAAHLEPEILIVDEVLAVGDAEFQKKCLGKMEDVAKNEGRTVLFVSHNMTAVENLCQTGVLLQNGKLSLSGDALDVINSYLAVAQTSENLLENAMRRIGNGKLRIGRVLTCNEVLKTTDCFRNGDDILIKIGFKCYSPVENVHAIMSIYNDMDVNVVNLSTLYTDRVFRGINNDGEILCRIPKNILNQGGYKMNISLIVGSLQTSQVLDKVDNVGRFLIEGGDPFKTGLIPPVGIVVLHADWEVHEDVLCKGDSSYMNKLDNY